ncbi:MAG: hypothetical protein WA154_09595 [Moraxellaceae bacterium]
MIGIELNKFLLKHKIRTAFGAPEQISEMPILHQQQILMLDAKATKQAYQAIHDWQMLSGDMLGNIPFADERFQHIQKHQISDDATLKKWLYQRPVAFADRVYVLPVFGSADEPAIYTTWKMIVKYAPVVFSGDNTVVVDVLGRWCLYYHHDDLLTFAH